MELSKKTQNPVWGEIYEIPITLQPTIFVIQPSKTVPTINYFKIIKDHEITNMAYLFLFHFSDADVSKNIPLATHISRITIKEDSCDWNAYQSNLFVIGWEKEETKESWKKFIINIFKNLDV